MSAPEAPAPAALSVRDLTLARGGRTLFSRLAFDAGPGRAILVRGPNGAGKTSLILALAGILAPEAGSIRHGGADDDPSIHLMLPQPGLKPRLTVEENLAFWRDLNGRTGLAPNAALEQVGLGGLGSIEAGHLSTGQLRRLALARLLVSRRTLWLLDEPTAALDADGEALAARLIDAHREAGGIVVAATHHDLGLRADGAGVETITLGGGT